MQIKSIQIKYFRSIYNETINLGDLNIFAGMNDVGKSNLLKALNLFFNGETGWGEPFDFSKDFNLKRNKELTAGRGGNKAKEISIKIIFTDIGEQTPIWEKTWRQEGEYNSLKYDKKLGGTKKLDKRFKPYSKAPDILNNIHYFYVPALKTSDYIGHLIGQLSAILSTDAFDSVNKAAGNFEKELAKYFHDISRDIEETLQIDSMLKFPTNLASILEKMEFSDSKGIVLKSRGDGIRTRHIPILLNKISNLKSDLKNNNKARSHFIWGYEEPESNVELKASFDMAEEFSKNYSQKHQILISTHSPAFYGMPERFVENWKQGEKSIYRYRVNQIKDASKYINDSVDNLDNDFLLPAVSEKMQSVYDENMRLNKAIAELESRDIFNKPTIIVEGKSDKIIFDKAIELFYPCYKEGVNVLASDDEGGANFVKSSLCYWEIAQRASEKEDKVKVIGVFDDDKAGVNAELKALPHIEDSKYVFSRTYKMKNQGHFFKLKNRGVNLPYELENLYSPKLWNDIGKQRFLQKRNNYFSLLADGVKERIASSGYSIEEFYKEIEFSIYVQKEIRDINAKTKVAEFIDRANDDDAREYLYLVKVILEQILKKIDVIS